MLEKVSIFGPASLSNLGPGFDTLGLCLEHIGDIVEVCRSKQPGITIELDECGREAGIPVDPSRNTAGVAAARVLSMMELKDGVLLRIKKGFTPGSGIGSSAACAAAAAWGVNALYGSPFTKDELVEAVLDGEAIASGARHGDNALPALLGGLILVSSKYPSQYRKIQVPCKIWIALISPRLQVLTKEARTLLPAHVPLEKAVFQASALGFMVDAFRAGDLEAVGHWMMCDQIAEPVRAQLVPCYTTVKTAALHNGAFGCALTGSGPAMFAITNEERHAQAIVEAMIHACTEHKIEATGYVSSLNESGATNTFDKS